MKEATTPCRTSCTACRRATMAGCPAAPGRTALASLAQALAAGRSHLAVDQPSQQLFNGEPQHPGEASLSDR